jgi:hypothetical protein
VVYAGVVGAETGTPDAGKRLFDDDIRIVTVRKRMQPGERKKDGCQLTCCARTGQDERRGKGKQVT